MLPILGGRDSTEVLQSSLFQKYKNLGKSEEEEKMPEKNAILLVLQYQEDAIRPELSGPARFRIQGGILSVTDEGRRTKSGRKSMCLILDILNTIHFTVSTTKYAILCKIQDCRLTILSPLDSEKVWGGDFWLKIVILKYQNQKGFSLFQFQFMLKKNIFQPGYFLLGNFQT